MSSFIKVEGFNLLVHYHRGKVKNLIELLSEGLLAQISNSSVHFKNGKKVSRIVGYQEFKTNSGVFISGYFHRSTSFNWEHVEEGGIPIEDPGSVDAMPRAKFIIDVKRHRIYWITPIGQTATPAINTFITYLKNLSVKFLKNDYIELYKSECLKEDCEPSARGQHNFLVENFVTLRTISMEIVPLIPKEMFDEFFTDKFRLLELTLKPKKSNPTADDFEELIEETEKKFDEAEGEAEIKVKAKDRKQGLVKNKVKTAIKNCFSKGTLLLKMKLQDKSDTENKNITITNIPKKGKFKEGMIDISLKESFESEIDSDETLEIVGKLNKRIIDSDKMSNEQQKLYKKMF